MFVHRHSDLRLDGTPMWGVAAFACPLANGYESPIQPHTA